MHKSLVNAHIPLNISSHFLYIFFKFFNAVFFVFNLLNKQKYLNPLKSQEHSSLIDVQTVDEIFLMVPAILGIHQQFLDELRSRLEIWEPLQRVGDAFVQVV